MAELHEATLTPRKDELVRLWLPSRPWWDGVDERGPAGSFRLDDPDGAVGMQGFLFGSEAGSTLFVPLTYRDAPLVGAERHLLGTMEHSVLGTRWVYDACADPVFIAAILDLIRSGGREAEQFLHRADGSVVVTESSATVRGEGAGHLGAWDSRLPITALDEPTRTLVTSGDLSVAVARRVGADLARRGGLVGGFEGGAGLLLAPAATRRLDRPALYARRAQRQANSDLQMHLQVAVSMVAPTGFEPALPP